MSFQARQRSEHIFYRPADNLEDGQLCTKVAQLKSQLAAALARIAELEQQEKKPPPFVKRNRPLRTEPPKPRKKRASKHNRSCKREEATRIERHALESCPDCNYRLRGESVDYSRQVIEIPAPQPVEVIEHQVIKRWCSHREGWRSPQLELSGQVIGQRRMVRIASLVSYLRTTLRLPVLEAMACGTPRQPPHREFPYPKSEQLRPRSNLTGRRYYARLFPTWIRTLWPTRGQISRKEAHYGSSHGICSIGCCATRSIFALPKCAGRPVIP